MPKQNCPKPTSSLKQKKKKTPFHKRQNKLTLHCSPVLRHPPTGTPGTVQQHRLDCADGCYPLGAHAQDKDNG